MKNIPVIENIHQKVLEAVTKGELKMDDWHTSKEKNEEGAYCGTTHCRAGWVVALGGKDAVRLEEQTSTEFAALQILHKSNPNIRVSPVRFYESNEKALADIKRCAELEKNQN
jgi:hypothetical protein